MKSLFKYIEKLAKIPSIYPEEKNIRDFLISILNSMNREHKVDKIGNLYLNAQKSSKTLLSAHMDKQAPPNYKDLGECIQGKLDDAVGIGIILTLSEKFEFHAFFSVGEEDELKGSKYALDNDLIPKVEKVIVVDTSPRGELGKGPILYISFDNKNPTKEYLDIILNSANSINVNLQIMDGSINDGINLIRAIPNTIALEPHIDNFHTSDEISSKKDIIDTYKVIAQYFRLEENGAI